MPIGKNGVHLLLQGGQVVHEVFDRAASGRPGAIGGQPFEPALGLAGEEYHSHLPRPFEIGRQPQQHGKQEHPET